MALTIPITVGQVSGGNYQPVSSLSSTNFTIRLSSATGTTISFSTFSNEGNGNYVFGGFTIPAGSTAQGASVNVAINGTLRPELGTFIVYADNDEPWTAQKTIDLAAARLDRGVQGQLVSAGCDTIFGQIQYDDAVAESSITGINRKGLIHKFYVDDNFATTASVSAYVNASLTSLATLTGANTFTGENTFNNARINFVATNLNLSGGTANAKHVSSTSMNIFTNASDYGNGKAQFAIQFKDTGGDTVNVFESGFTSGEQPYIDFKNSTVLNFNQTELPDIISAKQRHVASTFPSDLTNKRYRSFVDAIASCTTPSVDNQFDIIVHNTGGTISGTTANISNISYINYIGQGSPRIQLQANSFSKNAIWRDLKLKREDSSLTFTNQTFENCEIYIKNVFTNSALSATFINCKLKNCIVSVDYRAASLIEFTDSSNEVYNTVFSSAPTFTVGDVCSNTGFNAGLSASDWS